MQQMIWKRLQGVGSKGGDEFVKLKSRGLKRKDDLEGI